MRIPVSRCLPALVLTVLSLWVAPARAGSDEMGRVEQATGVLEEIMAIPEQGIPASLLSGTRGVVLIPGSTKQGYVVGGHYGRGVVLVRDKKGAWSNPSFVALAGGSFNLQIEVQFTDVVLLLRTNRSITNLKGGKLTLGADTAVAAGPVGRRGETTTKVQLSAEVLSYQRSRGLLAGVTLEGAVLQIDDEANQGFYGRGVSAGEIFDGKVGKVPEAAGRLRKTLAKYSR
jgi:lipid-binding SYLF domain-containing protein